MSFGLSTLYVLGRTPRLVYATLALGRVMRVQQRQRWRGAADAAAAAAAADYEEEGLLASRA